MEIPGREGRPTMTVVIPTHNRRSAVVEVVQGLSRQIGIVPDDFEVVVVADGCSDGTVAALRSLVVPFRLTVIEQVHSGRASARNRGAAGARGDVILFLDDDVVPLPSLLTSHRVHHETSTRCVVIGAVDTASRPRSGWEAYDDAMREKRQAALLSTERPSGIHSARNLSLRKADLEAAGGFRGNLPGNQEVELGHRLRSAGASFVFSAAASVADRSTSTYAEWLEVHSTRGKLDVATYKKGSDGHGLDQLFACFYERRPALRVALGPLVRWAGLRSPALWWASRAGRAAHGLGARAASLAAFSLIANTVYWSSVRDAVHGNRPFFSMIDAARHAPGPTIRVAPPSAREPGPSRRSRRSAKPGHMSHGVPDRPQDVSHGRW